jgi:hypothetical protein
MRSIIHVSMFLRLAVAIIHHLYAVQGRDTSIRDASYKGRKIHKTRIVQRRGHFGQGHIVMASVQLHRAHEGYYILGGWGEGEHFLPLFSFISRGGNLNEIFLCRLIGFLFPFSKCRKAKVSPPLSLAGRSFSFSLNSQIRRQEGKRFCRGKNLMAS